MCYRSARFSCVRMKTWLRAKIEWHSPSRRPSHPGEARIRMQVLLINQFFWPDTAATGQLLTDVAREIDPELHAVTVLCGRSVYGAVDSASPPPVRIVQSGDVAFSRGKIGRV